MSRTGNKYWEKEEPVEQMVNTKLLICYYPKAGVLQFFNIFDRGDSAGKRSKGVVVHLDETPSGEAAALFGFMARVGVHDQKMREKEMTKVPVVPAKPAAPRRTLADLEAEIAAG